MHGIVEFVEMCGGFKQTLHVLGMMIATSVIIIGLTVGAFFFLSFLMSLSKDGMGALRFDEGRDPEEAERHYNELMYDDKKYN